MTASNHKHVPDGAIAVFEDCCFVPSLFCASRFCDRGFDDRGFVIAVINVNLLNGL